MRRGILVAGVLGAGSALVFALAIAASTLFPNGGSIATNINEVLMNTRGPIAVPVAIPAPGVGVAAPWPASEAASPAS
jgi:hypothetical protein